MAKYLFLEDRNLIEQHLNEGCSFEAIANKLERNCTSISREVRNYIGKFNPCLKIVKLRSVFP